MQLQVSSFQVVAHLRGAWSCFFSERIVMWVMKEVKPDSWDVGYLMRTADGYDRFVSIFSHVSRSYAEKQVHYLNGGSWDE